MIGVKRLCIFEAFCCHTWNTHVVCVLDLLPNYKNDGTICYIIGMIVHPSSIRYSYLPRLSITSMKLSYFGHFRYPIR